MERYYCLNSCGKIIGEVDAINGDTAWLLTQITQPDAVGIKQK